MLSLFVADTTGISISDWWARNFDTSKWKHLIPNSPIADRVPNDEVDAGSCSQEELNGENDDGDDSDAQMLEPELTAPRTLYSIS